MAVLPKKILWSVYSMRENIKKFFILAAIAANSVTWGYITCSFEAAPQLYFTASVDTANYRIWVRGPHQEYHAPYVSDSNPERTSFYADFSQGDNQKTVQVIDKASTIELLINEITTKSTCSRD